MPTLSTGTLLRILAAAASLGAGVVHAAVVPGHLDAWAASGIFFALLAAFQALWAAAWLRRPGRLLLAVGLVVGPATMALWAWSRSPFGLPIGPDAGEPLEVGHAGVVSTVLELVMVAALLAWAWPARPRGGARGRGGVVATALLAVATIAVAGLSVSGVQAAFAHDHSAHGAGHGDGHSDRGGGHSGHRDAEQNEEYPDERHQQPAPSESRSTGTPGEHGDGHDHAH